MEHQLQSHTRAALQIREAMQLVLMALVAGAAGAVLIMVAAAVAEEVHTETPAMQVLRVMPAALVTPEMPVLQALLLAYP